MRSLVLILAATSLALAGCGKKDVTGNTSALDETVSAQDFSTNDTTAIDAATGADANMAADVNYTDLGTNNQTSNDAGAAQTSPTEHKTAKRASAPANAAANTAAAEPSNTAE